MNIREMDFHTFFRRHQRQIKEGSVIVLVMLFLLVYSDVKVVKRVVDLGLDPAVAGITVLYGKISTQIYSLTKINLGFVTIPPDQDFLFSVRLATYINDKRAGPLLDIAVDSRLPDEKRARALWAILKFDTTADWIQPFLNELPKGGLLGIYNEEAPLLDELIKKIRAEGGVRQSLVRAYAEVVFSFMLQVPDLVIRLHACKWLSDVIAEDAVFLLIPRFEREKEPKGQKAIEAALYDVRAVSEPETAKDLLLPFYKDPPWPGLRLPIAVILARLGHEGATEVVGKTLRLQGLPAEQRLNLSLAAAQTPYPRRLRITEKEQMLLAERQRQREEQVRVAMERRRQIIQQERVKQALIARAEQEQAALAAQTALEESRMPPPLEETPVVEEVPEVPAVVETPKQPEEVQKVAAVPIPAAKPVVTTPAQPVPVPAPTPKAEQVPPKPILPIPGEADVETQAKPRPSPEQVALLPAEPKGMPPPIEDAVSKPKSLMNYVDMIFEVKKAPVPLYENPGDSATGVTLPIGAKGKAEFEVLIGEDRWYQVKSKKGSGWADGKMLSLFNLSPMGDLPAVPAQVAAVGDNIEGSRKESTYFEASVTDVDIFEKPSEKAKKKGKLTEDTAYLAVRSEKSSGDRWFLLQIRAGETGWVRGIDIRLANVQQPVQLQIPTKPLSQRDKKSAFAAEWIVAGVKGVGVYERPSIAGKLVRQIDPPEKYKVVENSAANGKEWYRIELPGNKSGWVQTMDVNLTKKD